MLLKWAWFRRNQEENICLRPAGFMFTANGAQASNLNILRHLFLIHLVAVI